LAAICLVGTFLCLSGNSPFGDLLSLKAKKEHKIKLRYYLAMDKSFSPSWSGSDVLKLGLGDNDLVRTSSLKTPHVFGVRINEDDQL